MTEATVEPLFAREGQCLNFTGVFGPDGKTGTKVRTHCSAGVDYRRLIDDEIIEPGWFLRLPCIERKGVDWMPDRAECPKCQMPTPEQVAAHQEYQTFFERRLAKTIEAVNKARQLYIEATRAHPWYPKIDKPMLRQGTFPCPECHGLLTFLVTPEGSDGKCETEDCIVWRGCDSPWGRV